PAEFKSGHGLDVRPHPHIGLSTLTYLYDGEVIHRDSLGVKAAIHPGAVNWMTAGRGIVHSERTAPEHRVDGEPLHGLQFWVGMPTEKEEIDPGFAHLDGNELPTVSGEGKTVRLVAGSMFGARSPLKTVSETLFADVALDAGATMPLDAECEERGIYIVAGELDVSGDKFGAGQLLVFRPTDRITIAATQPSRIAVIGGAFVSSRKERIEQAKNEWREGRFAGVPGDEIESIPLPENRPY